VNRQFDENPESSRISADAKAKVSIGEFSRSGKSRDREAKKAEDHDMNPECGLVHYGIMGTSPETSDFIADCTEMWWDQNKDVNRTDELAILLGRKLGNEFPG